MSTHTYYSSTTWVCPTGVSSIDVHVLGCGGDGFDPSTCTPYGDQGAGGGSGAYITKTGLSVTAGRSYTITVDNTPGAQTVFADSVTLYYYKCTGGGSATEGNNPGSAGTASYSGFPAPTTSNNGSAGSTGTNDGGISCDDPTAPICIGGNGANSQRGTGGTGATSDWCYDNLSNASAAGLGAGGGGGACQEYEGRGYATYGGAALIELIYTDPSLDCHITATDTTTKDTAGLHSSVLVQSHIGVTDSAVKDAAVLALQHLAQGYIVTGEVTNVLQNYHHYNPETDVDWYQNNGTESKGSGGEGYIGVGSVACITPGSGVYEGIHPGHLPVTPSIPYTYSIYAKLFSGTSALLQCVNVVEDSGFNAIQFDWGTPTTITNAGWTRIVTTSFMPSNAAYVRPVTCTGLNQAAVFFLLDGGQLQFGNAVTDLTAPFLYDTVSINAHAEDYLYLFASEVGADVASLSTSVLLQLFLQAVEANDTLAAYLYSRIKYGTSKKYGKRWKYYDHNYNPTEFGDFTKDQPSVVRRHTSESDTPFTKSDETPYDPTYTKD
jgi:hypothetical protein